MPTILCGDCNTPVSTRADSCLSCGAPSRLGFTPRAPWVEWNRGSYWMMIHFAVAPVDPRAMHTDALARVDAEMPGPAQWSVAGKSINGGQPTQVGRKPSASVEAGGWLLSYMAAPPYRDTSCASEFTYISVESVVHAFALLQADDTAYPDVLQPAEAAHVGLRAIRVAGQLIADMESQVVITGRIETRADLKWPQSVPELKAVGSVDLRHRSMTMSSATDGLAAVLRELFVIDTGREPGPVAYLG